MKHRSLFRGLLLAGILSAAAACSGGDGSETAATEAPTTVPATTAAPSTSSTTTTTTPTTTTTEPATTTTVATTTTAPPPPTWPLTGLPLQDEIIALRPAIAVKLDNHKDARPHAGLNQADVVYEEIVEAQITRFFAIFHSTDAAPIGPIRSARNTDVDLLNQLGRPLFIWSGGNRGVVQAIGQADAVSMAHGQNPGLYYRDPERRRRTAIEHTLLAYGTQDIWQHIVPGQRVPTPLFAYRPAGAEPAGVPTTGFDVNMRSVRIRWTWSPEAQKWLREEYGGAHLDTTGMQVNTDNVVVQFIPYGTSTVDARSPQGYTVGEGDALIFSAGKVLLAHWSRPSADVPAVFTDADGATVQLTPGRTWLELAEAGVSQVVQLPPAG